MLDTACAGDAALRITIESLLASDREEQAFVETSIAAVAANLIGNEEPESLIGKTIGHYRIVKQIGAGGMGEVYLAIDTMVDRNAALKVLPAHLTNEAERLTRFQQEARAVARLNHPNIVTIYEVGAHNSTRYIASELIEGETVRQRLARGRIKIREAIEIAAEVASALVAAHSAGVVHRDIKPENIMVRADGYVKVLDFGIAKLAKSGFTEATDETSQSKESGQTSTGAILGTVSYMSPEQARGELVDKGSDIWSLGVLLYEMLTGQAPFTGATPAEVVSSILEKEPPPLTRCLEHVPPGLQRIVTKAAQKNPERRYHNANEMLEALNGLRHQLEFAAELEQSHFKHPSLRRMRSPVALALAGLIVFALVLAFHWFRNRTMSPAPEKSIAVLPFENLSGEPQNAYFVDGMQDEILTDLAKVADLKVISRASVMQYKAGRPRDLREIGRQLGVANIMEGSVQREGNRVRVNAQLMDARSDRPLWSQTYDGNLADMFSIESDIANTIAGQLQARLSANEKTEIEGLPTSDITAFDLYTHAKNLNLPGSFNNPEKKELLEQADLLSQAIGRDPSFFQAYCLLTWDHDQLYFYGFDHTPARLALAETAVETALRLRPDAGEAHLARAENLYRGYRNYNRALAELEIARHTLPNDARILQLMAFIQRRQGHWEESTRNLERALELDPRGTFTLQQMAWQYVFVRRYAEAKPLLARLLAIEPMHVGTELLLASIDFRSKADDRPLHQMIDSIRFTNPAAIPKIVEPWLHFALAKRDAAAARAALQASREDSINLGGDVYFSRRFIDGMISKMSGDHVAANVAFAAARIEQERAVQAQPEFAPAWCALGLTDAMLGRKEEAVSEGRRAAELLPVEKDAFTGPEMLGYLAMIDAWTGKKELACQQLAFALRFQGQGDSLSYGKLKLLPFWDPLRGDPCFEQIVASLAPSGN